MRSPYKLLLGLAVMVALVVGATIYLDHLNAEWNQRVENVQAFADSVVTANDSLNSEFDRERERSDSLIALVPEPRTVYRTVREVIEVPVPDTCQAFVSQRDSLLNEQARDYENLYDAYEAERRAANILRQANRDLLVAIDSLNNVLDDRPLPAPALAPRVGVGGFAGVCATGQPCIGVGVTISVKLPLHKVLPI